MYEKALLGTMLMSPETATIVFDSIHVDNFKNSDLFFRYKKDMIAGTLEPLTFCKENKIDFFELTRESVSPKNIESLINKTKEEIQLRRLKELSETIKNGSSIQSIVSNIKDALESVEMIDKKIEVHKMHEVAKYTVEQEEKGVGFFLQSRKLDRQIGILREGDMCVIGGRPGMGKTALMNYMALQYAKQGIKTMIISLEMTKESLSQRILSYLGNVNGNLMREKRLSDNDLANTKNAIKLLEDYELYITDESELDIFQLRSFFRKYSLQGFKVFFIDYLDKISADGREKRLMINKIIQEIKRSCKDYNILGFPLSQLSRDVEKRNDKRPAKSDLIESGKIEAEADVILLLYRDEYYNKDTKKMNIMEVDISKNRNGNTGIVELGFYGEYQRIVDASYIGCN